MSDLIQLLPDAIANQIAAGEVVQRPASVVKELLENAIDSGAQRIQVIVKDAGKALIQVVDDGCGMSETDARMSFERHATSKIREARDLFAIRTMGFRGEALASIAAVAQVEMKTRRHTEELGTLIRVEGSTVLAQEPCQCAPGTSIAVKNLFYNVPARRNFLKSNQAEMRHILDEFQRVAIANPDLFFSLNHNGNELFHLSPGNMRQRIVAVFGQATNKKLVPVEEETDVLRVYGFIGKPDYAKKTRGEQLLFVNDRFIKSGYLNHAILTAYDDLLAEKTYPLYVIFFEIDPSRIDINVHPTKQEIKFDDERMVYNFLRVAIKHALGQYSIMPSLDFEQDVNFGRRIGPSQPQQSPPGPTKPPFEKMAPKEPFQVDNLQNWDRLYKGLEAFDEEETPSEEVPRVVSSKLGTGEDVADEQEELDESQRVLVQLHQAYILSPIKSGFLLVDQQAAHERVLYEQYLQALKNQERSVQQKLFPQTLELSPQDAVILQSMLPQINLLGFDIQEFGSHTFVINGAPADLQESEQVVIEQLLGQFRQNVDLQLDNSEKLAQIMAKSAALKRGKRLDESEMRSLIDRLFACEMPFQSPSGRKCFVQYKLEELERRFLG